MGRAAEDRAFLDQLMNDPMSALAEYELSPQERDKALVFTQGARNLPLRFAGSKRVIDSAFNGESERFSEMSLGALYELAWAAGDAEPELSPELSAEIDADVEAWYKQNPSRYGAKKKKRGASSRYAEWAEALLADLEARRRTAAPDDAAPLDDACVRVRRYLDRKLGRGCVSGGG